MDRLTRELYAALHNFGHDAEQGCHASFTLHPDFIGFSGHFPEHPILPAVAQIQMACLVWACCEAESEALAIAPQAATVDNAKFMRPVGPGETVMVSCTPFQSAHKAILRVQGQTASSFTFTLSG